VGLADQIKGQQMQKKRYWGLGILSVIWMLVVVFMNAATGKTGTSATTLMWALVAFYAFVGNISAVASIAKFVSILQVVIGTILFFVLIGSPDMQLYFGSPGEFLLSVGIPTIVWVLLFSWAKSESEKSQPVNSTETTATNAIKSTHEEPYIHVIEAKVEKESTSQNAAQASKYKTKKSESLWIFGGVAIAALILFFFSQASFTPSARNGTVAPSAVRQTPAVQQTKIEIVYLDLIDSEWVRGFDGVNSTFRVLVKNNSRFAVDAPEISAKMEPCDSNIFLVRSAQQALNSLGFDAGPVDGRIGSRTQTAIAQFQTSRGIYASQKLDDATTKALGISQSEASYPSFGRGFIVGGYEIPPGDVAYVDFINFYGQTRGREFCYRVSREFRVTQN
jgi:hypothetical protein